MGGIDRRCRDPAPRDLDARYRSTRERYRWMEARDVDSSSCAMDEDSSRGSQRRTTMERIEGKVSVILPTYNERENVAVAIWLIDRAFKDLPNPYEVVVVDDASPDGTQEVVKQVQSVLGEDKVVLRPRKGKLGLGSAYAHGLAHATGRFVIVMDADLSHHPKYIPDMVRMQRETGCDIVSGTRYAYGGGVYGWGFFRKLTSRVANFLADTMLDPRVSDLTGSFRLYRIECFQALIEKVASKGYAFQMEIIVHARAMGMSIKEVPIVFVDRLYGKSKLGGSEIVQYLKGLLRLFLTV